MLVIKLELWPMGSEKNKRELGRIDLWNNLKGTREYGSYEFTVTEDASPFNAGPLFEKGSIDDHPRRSYGWDVVKKALNQIDFQKLNSKGSKDNV